jgi:hypothetical protein
MLQVDPISQIQHLVWQTLLVCTIGHQTMPPTDPVLPVMVSYYKLLWPSFYYWPENETYINIWINQLWNSILNVKRFNSLFFLLQVSTSQIIRKILLRNANMLTNYFKRVILEIRLLQKLSIFNKRNNKCITLYKNSIYLIEKLE